MPQFDLNSIAIEAVNGLKTVAKVLGNINVVNSTLVTCIMDLKRELEDSQKVSPVPPGIPMPTMPPQTAPESPASQPMAAPDSTTPTPKTRKYRGRDY